VPSCRCQPSPTHPLNTLSIHDALRSHWASYRLSFRIANSAPKHLVSAQTADMFFDTSLGQTLEPRRWKKTEALASCFAATVHGEKGDSPHDQRTRNDGSR